jgi:hypothetical protein
MEIETMNRHDVKYIIDCKTAEELRKCLIANNMRKQIHDSDLVVSAYCDTDDFASIRKCIDDPMHKEKIRIRSYGPIGDDDMAYLEIKRKESGLLTKRRIRVRYGDIPGMLSGSQKLQGEFGDELDDFLSRYPNVEPRVRISYERESYKTEIESTDLRVTLDRNIRYKVGNGIRLDDSDGTLLMSPRRYIVEIKTIGDTPKWLDGFFKSRSLKPRSYSKYAKAYIKAVRNNSL